MAKRQDKLQIGPVAFLVAGLMFMELLDASILPNAAPTIARSFHIQSEQIGICVTTYMLALVVLIPVSAWLADKYGVRATLFSGILIFIVGSALCSVSKNLPELTLSRIFQGIGAATMVPVGRLILMRSVDKSDVIRVISYSVWPALLAPVVAPTLGGFIIANSSWPWIFIVNVPIGLFALLIGAKIVPDIKGSLVNKLDWSGFVLTSLGLGLLVFAAADLGQPHIRVLRVLGLGIIGLLANIFAFISMNRKEQPFVNFSPLKFQTFSLNSASGFLYRIAQNTTPFVLPLLFQDKFGWSAEKAGEVLFFYMFGNLGFKFTTTYLMNKFGFKPLLLVTTLLGIPATLGMGFMGSNLPLAWIAALLIFAGSVRSLGLTLYNTIAFADVDQELMAHANTLSNMTQQLAAVFGVALAVIAINAGRWLFGVSHEFSTAFTFAALMLVASLWQISKLARNAGDSLRN